MEKRAKRKKKTKYDRKDQLANKDILVIFQFTMEIL